MPKPASTRPAYKMLTCIYLCRTLLFFAPYADFSKKNSEHKIAFLMSWNEWAEGNYVEPDLKYGHGYLDVLREMIVK